MPDTITQILRPYFKHADSVASALDRAGDADYYATLAADECARLHVRIAAKRARVALYASPVEPVLDPSWVGTVNMDAGFDPARREEAAYAARKLLWRHAGAATDALCNGPHHDRGAVAAYQCVQDALGWHLARAGVPGVQFTSHGYGMLRY